MRHRLQAQQDKKLFAQAKSNFELEVKYAELFETVISKLQEPVSLRAANECVKPFEEMLALPLPSIVALKNPWMLEVCVYVPILDAQSANLRLKIVLGHYV